VAAFITDRALVTVRKNEGFDVDAVVQRWDDSRDLAKSGVGYLVHGLLDYIVDSHFDAVQTLDEQIESLVDLVFADRVDHAKMQHRSLRLRKSLVKMRRVVLPMREVLLMYSMGRDNVMPGSSILRKVNAKRLMATSRAGSSAMSWSAGEGSADVVSSMLDRFLKGETARHTSGEHNREARTRKPKPPRIPR
jgi:Mg2+ and Co2+ transporter CorA